MLLIYRLSIWLYSLIIHVLSFNNAKAQSFVNGRKMQKRDLLPILRNQGVTRYWVHVASLGEFEQARPILEGLKLRDSSCEIILTFFSPSGYEAQKHYPLANHLLYLPIDTKSNAVDFLDKIKPDKAIFIKYEFWYFFLDELQKRNIPTYLVSGVFRKSQMYFHFLGGFMRRLFRGVDHFFVQDERSAFLLRSIYIEQVLVSGDTRFDRVIAVAEKKDHIAKVVSFIENEKVIVFGSTWRSDMAICEPFIKNKIGDYKFIIAPHSVASEEIAFLMRLPKAVRFSENIDFYDDTRVMVIDNIGLLSSIYRYADIAYIGGAFNGTLHNTLEAAVYGIPVIWGSHQNNKKFIEAQSLMEVQAGFDVANENDLARILGKFENPQELEKCGKAAFDFVRSNAGATGKVLSHICDRPC